MLKPRPFRLAQLFPLCVTGLALINATPSLAAPAHVHGLAHMNVALDGQELVIEMESPLANLIGFEHEPSTPEQHERLDKAVADLKKPSQLFSLPAGGECHAEKVTLKLAHMGEHAEHEAEGHVHQDEHEQEKHADHDEHAGHADADLSYSFHCENAAAMKTLSLTPLFKRFPHMEKVRVQAIGPNGQTGVELNREADELRF